MIEDIPFDGDMSKPLPENLKKVRRAQVEYTMKLLDKPEFQLPAHDALVADFLAFGMPKTTEIDQAEQEENNRVRLEVEIEAIRKRQLERQHHQDKINTVYRSIDLMLQHNLDKVISKPLKYLADVKDLGHYKRICSALGSENLSINQYAELIDTCDWISKDYIRLANSATVRADLNATTAPEATDSKQAVNILGANNASALFPRLILEHNFKQHSGLAKEMWSRLMKLQQISSIAAFKLAEHHNLNAQHAFLTNSFALLPYMVFLNLFTAEAKKAKLATHNKAMTLKDDFKLSVLDKYEPGSDVIYKLYHFAPSLLESAIDSLNCVHIPAVEILNGETGFEDRKLIANRAFGYAAYRLLMSAKKIAPEEANTFLQQYNMDQESLNILQKIDFAKMNVFKMRKT